MTLIAALLCAGCGSLTTRDTTRHARPAGPAPAHHRQVSRLPRLLDSPPPASLQASPPAGLSAPGREFVAGVDGYCRSWYFVQKRGNVRYPNSVAQSLGTELPLIRTLTARLPGLHPPPSMAAAFQAFISNENAVLRAVAQAESDARQDTSGPGSDMVASALERRHQLARPLGASECDGLLPPSQWRAAVRAVQRFDLTTDPHQFCVSLVTPQFVITEWADTGDAMGSCLKEFHVHRLGSLPVPHNIRVDSVTGVDGLSATVSYHEVPECGCGKLTARLFDEHGRWLVSDAWTD